MPHNNDEKLATDTTCRKCHSTHVTVETWDSSDGAYTDYHYRCKDCKHEWWIDGPDY